MTGTDLVNFVIAVIGIIIAVIALRHSHQSNVLAKRALQQQEDANKKELEITAEVIGMLQYGYQVKVGVVNHGIRVNPDRVSLVNRETEDEYYVIADRADGWLESNDRWDGGTAMYKPGDNAWPSFSTATKIVVRTKCGYVKEAWLRPTVAKFKEQKGKETEPL